MAEAILEVMDASARERRNDNVPMLPIDVWDLIAVRCEITDVLRMALGGEGSPNPFIGIGKGMKMVGIPDLQRILRRDHFWERKFMYDFPDLVEFVGTELPEWIIPGDPEAEPEFRDLPWRRYYYVCRYFMRTLFKMMLFLGDAVQDDMAQQTATAFHPLKLDSDILPGSTYMVRVRMYHRNLDMDTPFGPIYGPVSTEPAIMTIWEYCSRFILRDPHETLDPMRPFPVPSTEWFNRDLRTNTNIIRAFMVNTLAYNDIMQDDILFTIFYDWMTRASMEHFYTWMFRAQPVEEVKFDISDEGKRVPRPLKNRFWVQHLIDPALDPGDRVREEAHMQLVIRGVSLILEYDEDFFLERGRHLIRGPASRKYLIGDSIEPIGTRHHGGGHASRHHNNNSHLLPGKAAIMLHEHNWRSERQRRYFGWVAGGKK